MLTYTMTDGNIIQGNTATEVVAAMAGMKMTEPKSIKSYRKAVSRRVHAATQREIRTNTDAEFLADMEECGLIERAPE